jgi:hypothetical protein
VPHLTVDTNRQVMSQIILKAVFLLLLLAPVVTSITVAVLAVLNFKTSYFQVIRKDIDIELTLSSYWDALLKGEVRSSSEALLEKARLKITLAALPNGEIRVPLGITRATKGDYVLDKRQYLLTIENPTAVKFEDIELYFQFPLPVASGLVIEHDELSAIRLPGVHSYAQDAEGYRTAPDFRQIRVRIERLAPKKKAVVALFMRTNARERSTRFEPSTPETFEKDYYCTAEYSRSDNPNINIRAYLPLSFSADRVLSLGEEQYSIPSDLTISAGFN